jgi:glycosyltransferase involved in cell wall biosynthesis
MNILHIIDSGGLYGAEVMLLNLCAEQREMGLDPVIASIGDPHVGEKPLEAEARRRGLRVESFRMRPGPNLAGALQILRFARSEQVDILHSHGYKGNILFGLMPKVLRRIPMVSTLHGWTWTGGWSRMGLYEWLDRLSLRFIDRVVIVNDAMRDKVRINELHVVNNGIPASGPCFSTIDPTNPMDTTDPLISSFSRQGFTIAAVGRLSPEKGFELLLEAVAGLVAEGKDVRLVILGEGGERGRLEKMAEELGLGGRVLMPGYVADAGHYFSLFGAFAIPSFTEGLPMVLLEAMAAGIPVVATKVGGIPHVLEQGTGGLLVEPGDVAALTRGIAAVIDDPASAERRRQHACRRVREHYSSRAMANKYTEIYQSIMNQTFLCLKAQKTQKTQKTLWTQQTP